MDPVVAAASQLALLAISSTAGAYDEPGKEIKGQKMRQRQKKKSIHLVLMLIETEIFCLLFLIYQPACTEENKFNKLNCRIIQDRSESDLILSPCNLFNMADCHEIT